MDYRIVERESFPLLAKVKAFRNESISEAGNTEIPDFWKQCGADNTFEILRKHSKIHDTYGICAPISQEETHFNYGIRRRKYSRRILRLGSCTYALGRI